MLNSSKDRGGPVKLSYTSPIVTFDMVRDDASPVPKVLGADLSHGIFSSTNPYEATFTVHHAEQGMRWNEEVRVRGSLGREEADDAVFSSYIGEDDRDVTMSRRDAEL